MARCWKDYIEDLQQKLLDKSLTYKDICDEYNCTRERLGKVIKKYNLQRDPDKESGIIKTYKCKYCGKEFTSKQKLGGHVLVCELNPNRQQAIENLAKARENIKQNIQHYYCKYCNKEIIGNKGALVKHEMHCQKNPNRVKCYGNYGRTKGHIAWNKGLTLATNEIIRQWAEKIHKYYQDHDGAFKGKHHTQETKEKLRKIMEEIVSSKNISPFRPNYSLKGCKYIDSLNKKNGWNLQHAKNGGEKEICGYFVDGYDEKLNIVFEYDEAKHYKDVQNNILEDKDVERQNYIKEKTNCTFYRYNENMDLFYQV